MCIDMDERNGSNSDEDEDGKERPVFSLLTGTYRHPKRYGDGGKPLPFNFKLTIIHSSLQIHTNLKSKIHHQTPHYPLSYSGIKIVQSFSQIVQQVCLSFPSFLLSFAHIIVQKVNSCNNVHIKVSIYA